ncbi:hypothetical protein ACJCHP_004509 [Enterobacter asburiae]
MTIPSYISEAYNSGALVTGVNPQTGSFHASIKLAEISVGVQDPIRFALNLSIGPQTLALSTLFGNYVGYYAALNIPRIDINQNRIYMPDGSVEELINIHDDEKKDYRYLFRSKRLNNIRISKIFEPTDTKYGYPRFTVEYKGGVVEHYNRAGLIVRIVSPTGHYIHFTHAEDNYCNLIQVCSGASADILSEIAIVYHQSGAPATITKTLNPKTASAVEEVARITSSNLVPGQSWYITEIQLPGDDDKYTFAYEEVIPSGARSLKQITTPYGGDYSATYHPDTTQKYGTVDGEMQYVAVVDSFRGKVIPIANTSIDTTQNNDEIYQTYTYGDLSESEVNKRENNFTGYDGTNPNYTPNTATDNCFWKTTDYIYTTVETNENLSPKLITTRKYNRFHLLVSEIKTLDSSEYYRETTIYTYGNIIPDKDINGQASPQYMLWTTCATTYDKIKNGTVVPGQTRTETRTCVHDDWGNLLTDTAPSGIKHQYEWYPAAGETDKCAAAPFNMPAYLKLLTIIPDQAAAVKPANKTKGYTYYKVSGNNSSYQLPPATSPTPETVNISPFGLYPEKITENSVDMATHAYQATGTTFKERVLTGALLSTTHTLGTTDSSTPANTTTVVTQQLNSWNINDNYTILTHGLSTTTQKSVTTGGGTPVKDPLKTRRRETAEYRLADGRLEKRITPADSTVDDLAINETTYTYDVKNRLTKIEDFSNHANYKETENISYAAFSSDTRGVVVTNTRNTATETTTYNYRMLPATLKQEVTGLSSATQSYGYAADGNVISSQLQESLRYSTSATTEREITTVSRYSFGALEQKVETPFTGLFFQGDNPANPGGTVHTERAGGSSVRFESVYNKYGQVASTRQYRFSNRTEENSQNLTSNEYDGFGRLMNAKSFTGVNSENTTDYSLVEYTYDAFDRVISETVSHINSDNQAAEKIHKTEYQYHNTLFNFESPVSIKYGKPDANNLLPTDATESTQLWDTFGRLTEKKTKKIELGIDKNIVTTHIYKNNTFDRPEKTTVNDSATNVIYTYEPVIGTPLTMVLNNTTGVNHPLSTSVAFTYNKTDKQLSAAEVKYSPATDVDSDTIRNQYTLTYKGEGIVDKCIFSCVKTDKNGANAATSLSTEILYNFSVKGKLQQLDYKLDNILLLTKSLSYAGSAAECLSVKFNVTGLANAIDVSISEVFSGNSRYVGKPYTISVSLKGFYSDTDTAKQSLSLNTAFTYDNFGRQKSTTYFNNAKGGKLKEELKYDAQSRVKTRSFDIWRKQSDRKFITFKNTYTYINRGSAVPLQGSQQTSQVAKAAEITRNDTTYTFNGATEFTTVNNTIKAKNDTYTYLHDAVKGMTTSSPANTALALSYNSYGNVNQVTGTGGNVDKGADLTYNIFNQPAVFNKFNHEQTDIAKQWSPTTYEYDAFNRVCKITTRDFPTATTSTSVFLIYDGDDVFAEIEATNTTTTAGLITASIIVSRCVYLWIEGRLLGRFLETEVNTSTSKKYLDWYMTDSSGSVRGVTRYRYGVASTASDSAVTTFFDFSDYGARTDITNLIPS